MKSFKSFLENHRFVDMILNEFNGGTPSSYSGSFVYGGANKKIWSAKKAEIIQMWKGLKSDSPIIIQPMIEKPEGVEKSSYGEDGVRITGSFQFITAVLSRLKEIISYENPDTKLRLVFRGVDSDRQVRPDRQSFVFYINLERRSKKRLAKKKFNLTGPTIPPVS
jgi:hypothetical protein